MKTNISIDLDDESRALVNAKLGKKGMATRKTIKDWTLSLVQRSLSDTREKAIKAKKAAEAVEEG
jgi:hypothetical protein